MDTRCKDNVYRIASPARFRMEMSEQTFHGLALAASHWCAIGSSNNGGGNARHPPIRRYADTAATVPDAYCRRAYRVRCLASNSCDLCSDWNRY